jgi:hypothetical protein
MGNFIKSDSIFKILGYVLFVKHLIVDAVSFYFMFVVYALITAFGGSKDNGLAMWISLVLIMCIVTDVLFLYGMIKVNSNPSLV